MIRTAGAAGAAAVLLASGAQVASAAPALVNGSGITQWTQPAPGTFSLLIKVTPQGGGAPVTYGCLLGQYPNVIGGPYGNAGTPLQGYVDTFRLTYYGQCTSPSGGALLVIQQHQRLNAEKSGAAFSLSSPISWKITLSYGSTLIASSANGPNVAWSVPWTNGNVSAPSHLTFSNTLVGYSGPNVATQQMVVTGTLNVANVSLI
jgi:hypothetical protein